MMRGILRAALLSAMMFEAPRLVAGGGMPTSEIMAFFSALCVVAAALFAMPLVKYGLSAKKSGFFWACAIGALLVLISRAFSMGGEESVARLVALGEALGSYLIGALFAFMLAYGPRRRLATIFIFTAIVAACMAIFGRFLLESELFMNVIHRTSDAVLMDAVALTELFKSTFYGRGAFFAFAWFSLFWRLAKTRAGRVSSVDIVKEFSAPRITLALVILPGLFFLVKFVAAKTGFLFSLGVGNYVATNMGYIGGFIYALLGLGFLFKTMEEKGVHRAIPGILFTLFAIFCLLPSVSGVATTGGLTVWAAIAALGVVVRIGGVDSMRREKTL